jgi:4-hydroxy-tetrahydrodipicolinate synthase
LIDRARVREALTGPVMSTRTPFLRNGDIDYNGLRTMIDRCIANGSKTVLLTHGDSLYSVLSDREIAEVTRVAAEHTAGRALVVAADRHWWTGQEIEFAQYCRSVGVDILMVLPPDWAASCTARSFADHYAAVAQHIPVMVVTNVFARSPDLGLEVLKILRDEVDNVVAVKDDLVGSFAREMTLLVKDKMAVISGGAKEHHLSVAPYGCKGSFSTFIHFKPEVTWAYWRAIEAGDMEKAAGVIRDYELPWRQMIMKQPGGWNAGLYGVMELFGYVGRWRRPPYYSLNDAEMERLSGLLKGRGWL